MIFSRQIVSATLSSMHLFRLQAPFERERKEAQNIKVLVVGQDCRYSYEHECGLASLVK